MAGARRAALPHWHAVRCKRQTTGQCGWLQATPTRFPPSASAGTWSTARPAAVPPASPAQAVRAVEHDDLTRNRRAARSSAYSAPSRTLHPSGGTKQMGIRRRVDNRRIFRRRVPRALNVTAASRLLPKFATGQTGRTRNINRRARQAPVEPFTHHAPEQQPGRSKKGKGPGSRISLVRPRKHVSPPPSG